MPDGSITQVRADVKVSLKEVMPLCVKDNGANPKTVMERLGHKNIKTTLQTYTFNTNLMQQTAADIFEKAING